MSTVLLGLLVLLPTLYLAHHFSSPSRSSSAPPNAPSRIPFFGSLKFFTHRWDFCRESKAASKSGHYSFSLAGLPVVGLSGAAGRESFFGSKHFSFDAGYAVLFGMAPKPSEIAEAKQPEGATQSPTMFTKRVLQLMKRDRMVSSLDLMHKDVKAMVDGLGKEGITNPFESVYLLVFQLTVRVVGCREIASDPILLKRVLRLFEDVEHSTTATTILFPWLPCPAKVKRTVSATKLYLIFQQVIDGGKRRGEGKMWDPLQHLLDEGDSPREILEFVIAALFAGQLNSGINACYILCYLARSPEWLSKARTEITSVLAAHTVRPSAPLSEQLADILFEAWESEFPMLDLCLKDTIRLHLQGAALRRNISGKTEMVGHEAIDDGTVLTYHLADVHMDPEIYPEPEKWDPSRYLPDRAEDKKAPFGWVGWGVGRHPCLGMRFAKLEQNLILAYILTTFDFELTNATGAPRELPPIDPNAHSAVKPSEDVYLKYTSRLE